QAPEPPQAHIPPPPAATGCISPPIPREKDAKADSALRHLLPQAGHEAVSVDSDIEANLSNLFLQVVQAYSYNGMLILLATVGVDYKPAIVQAST
ncbi:uncharacterized protein METZ01_LOCUS515490, partial [marine metagenome]